MDFLEKLDRLMEEHGLNKHTLSQNSGVPYSTIVDFYKKGYGNVRISTIQRFCKFFNVTLDYLLDDDITDVDYGKNKTPPTSESTEADTRLSYLIDCYYSLNAEGQNRLVEQAEFLKSSGRYDKHSNIPSEMNA